MIDFPLRTDEYSRNFYIIQNGEFQLIPYLVGDYCSHNISFSVLEEKQENFKNFNNGFFLRGYFP